MAWRRRYAPVTGVLLLDISHLPPLSSFNFPLSSFNSHLSSFLSPQKGKLNFPFWISIVYILFFRHKSVNLWQWKVSDPKDGMKREFGESPKQYSLLCVPNRNSIQHYATYPVGLGRRCNGGTSQKTCLKCLLILILPASIGSYQTPTLWGRAEFFFWWFHSLP